MVFERLVPVRLGLWDNLRNSVVWFQPPSLLIGKVWVLVIYFVHVSYTAKCIWELAGGLDRADWFQCNLWYGQSPLHSLEALLVGIGGSILSILTQFPSNRLQHVMVVGCPSKLVNVVSGVRQGRVLGPLLLLLYTLELFFNSGKQADRLFLWLHFDGCRAIPRR